MVITSRILQEKWGIDPEIADYFANERAVPKDNLHWGNRRIYISGGFGFLFIPIVFDLIHKLGIDKKDLLEENHVKLTELILHYSQEYELNQINFNEFINKCKKLVSNKIKQPNFYRSLNSHFSREPLSVFEFETKYKALGRGDSYLFTLVNLKVTDEWIKNFLPYWYGVMRPIFLFDDFRDLEEDKRNGEENIIIEMGGNADALTKATEMALFNINVLKEINEKLSNTMTDYLNQILELHKRRLIN